MDVGTIKKDDSLMDCDMECDNVDGTATVIKQCSSSLEKQKTRKRQKLRRLTTAEHVKKNVKSSSNKCKRILIVTLLITVAIALLLGHYFTQNNTNTKHILKEFLKNYHKQYRSIVHGQNNYCDKKLDISTLFTRQQQILHQDDAIKKIEIALRNESYLNAIALVGPVGVGKSLFLRAFQENFPWQENIRTYAWNTYVNDEAEKFHLIRIIIENLSDCGQNLVIIENLKSCDNGVVSIINQLLLDAIKKQSKHVVLFYVFSLNTMLNETAYAAENKLLQVLPNCNVINFKNFTQNELKDCIKREAEIENISLTKDIYDEIVNTIDPFKSGCKNVNAKLLMYSTIKSKDYN